MWEEYPDCIINIFNIVSRTKMFNNVIESNFYVNQLLESTDDMYWIDNVTFCDIHFGTFKLIPLTYRILTTSVSHYAWSYHLPPCLTYFQCFNFFISGVGPFIMHGQQQDQALIITQKLMNAKNVMSVFDWYHENTIRCLT